MSVSTLVRVNKKIENAVVGGYKRIEKAVTSAYKKVEDKFVACFLTEEGESIEEAKKRHSL